MVVGVSGGWGQLLVVAVVCGGWRRQLREMAGVLEIVAGGGIGGWWQWWVVDMVVWGQLWVVTLSCFNCSRLKWK